MILERGAGKEGEREGEGERERERETSMQEGNIDLLPLVDVPARDQTHILGICPDWESNP